MCPQHGISQNLHVLAYTGLKVSVAPAGGSSKGLHVVDAIGAIVLPCGSRHAASTETALFIMDKNQQYVLFRGRPLHSRFRHRKHAGLVLLPPSVLPPASCRYFVVMHALLYMQRVVDSASMVGTAHLNHTERRVGPCE